MGSDIAFSARALASSTGSFSTFLAGPKPSSSSSLSLSSSASDLGGDSASLYFSLYFARSFFESSFILLYFSVLSFSIRLASGHLFDLLGLLLLLVLLLLLFIH